MFCRNCGNQIADAAEICPKCGVRPLNATGHCQQCGAATSELQEMCTQCGTSLRVVKPKQKWYEKTGLITLWTILFFPVGFYGLAKNTTLNSKKKLQLGLILGGVLVVLFVIGSRMPESPDGSSTYGSRGSTHSLSADELELLNLMERAAQACEQNDLQTFTYWMTLVGEKGRQLYGEEKWFERAPEQIRNYMLDRMIDCQRRFGVGGP